MIARLSRFLATCARHAVPLGGILAQEWHPVTALAVYWVESVLLVIGAALLSRRMFQHTSGQAIADARREGDEAEARRLETTRRDLEKAHIEPDGVLVFYLGSLGVFAGFLAGVIVILVGNGHIPPPRWAELSDAAQVIAIIVAIDVAIDLFRFDTLTVAALRQRVDACLTRWSLFWLVGFVGTILMAITGRPTIIFGFFAVLKVIFESWGRLARTFGWRSLDERGLTARSSGPS